MTTPTQRTRVRRMQPGRTDRPVRRLDSRPPQPIARPVSDPRTFLVSARRRIGAASIVAFSAFLGLAAFNVVGVTAHASSSSDGASASPAPALVLPPGDFFGQPGTGGVFGPVAQPPVILGGGQPMLSSSGS